MADVNYIYRIWADESSTPYVLRDQRVGGNSAALITQHDTVIPAVNEVFGLVRSGYTTWFGIINNTYRQTLESTSWTGPVFANFDSYGLGFLYVYCPLARAGDTAKITLKNWNILLNQWDTVFEKTITFNNGVNTIDEPFMYTRFLKNASFLGSGDRFVLELERAGSDVEHLPDVSAFVVVHYAPSDHYL